MDTVMTRILVQLDDKAIATGEGAQFLTASPPRESPGADPYFICDACKKQISFLFDSPNGTLVCEGCLLVALSLSDTKTFLAFVGPLLKF